ncbi:Wzz/FepE/Etk N-terminal domain-containing protein [Silvimonas soli]|uniref:Wzz/FepE/Etk N-terminal domain-containing protein n=1 Tax=Silvimonas soli TaxID=2980100 RepID=UPI0024B32A63|nr:Wzz/FepE/Etk N-terminal domain-containing protein [Silvimonas soli]
MTTGQLFQILKARKRLVLAVTTVMVLLMVAVVMFYPPRYAAEAILTIDVGSVDPISGLPDASTNVPGYLSTQAKIIESHNTAIKVIHALKLNENKDVQDAFVAATQGRGALDDWLADKLLQDIDAKVARDSNIITIKYTSGDPKFSSTLANAFASAYVSMVTDIRSTGQQQNNAFFQTQLKSLQANLAAAQQKLADFQQKNGIIATDERLDVETLRLNDLSTQMVVAQAQSMEAHSRARGGANQPDVLNNPLVQNLKAQVAQLESKFKELAAKEGSNNPAYQQAQAELQEARSQLNQAMATYSSGLSSTASNAGSRFADQKHELEMQRDKVLQLKTLRAQSQILEQEVLSDQNAFDAALRRQTETSMESRVTRGNPGVLKSAPEPLGPSFPKAHVLIPLGLILGLLFGTVIAVLVELSNRRLRSVIDVELLLNLPVLATISPKHGKMALLQSKLTLNSGAGS